MYRLILVTWLVGVALYASPADAQTKGETVESGRLKCTNQTRLRWDCLVDGNDAKPEKDWTLAPEGVANLFYETPRTTSVFCEPIQYDVRNGELVERKQLFTIFKSYVLGPFPGVTRAVGLKCSSGQPPEEILLAYLSVWFPNGSRGCDGLGHPYLEVQCASDRGLRCSCNQSGHWRCDVPRDPGDPAIHPF